MDWTPALLDRATAALGVLYPDEWPLVAKQIGAKNGGVKYTYGIWVDDLEQSHGWEPRHDTEQGTVLIRNPFPGRNISVDGRLVYSSYIEIDASAAEKILFLGIPK